MRQTKQSWHCNRCGAYVNGKHAACVGCTEGQFDKIARIAKAAAQEVARGTCYHTNIGEMRTLVAIIEKAIHDGAGHWMNGFADAHNRINAALTRCATCGSGDDCECDHCQTVAAIRAALTGEGE